MIGQNLTDRRTNLEWGGAILQAGQWVAPFRQMAMRADLDDENHLIPVRRPVAVIP
jgi:hypothetical protein